MRLFRGREIRWEAVALVLVLLLAAGLRLRGIGRDSLWFDEAATVHIVTQPLPRMMELIRSDERTPPLHYLILHCWIRLFGDSETSVRLPSAIAGAAAVWFLYALTARLTNPTAGVVAALLLALSRYQIAYSQEARAYSLMLLLALASCDLFARLLRRRTPGTEAAYVVVTALLLYAHLYGVFTILAQHVAFAAELWRRRRRDRRDDAGAGEAGAERTDEPLSLRRWVLLNLAVLALFSPWVPTAIAWTRSVNTGFWVKPMTPAEIGHAFRLYTGSAAALVLLILLAGFGVARARRRDRLTLLIALATLPVVVPVIVSSLGKPTFTDRYGIVAPAGLYALAGAGVAAVGVQFVQVACVAALGAITFTARPALMPKPQWREAGRYLNQHLRGGDVAVITRKNATYLYDYYVHRPDVRRIGFDSLSLPLSLPLDPPGRHVWLIVHSDRTKPEQILDRATWAAIVSERHFRYVDIYELKESSPTTPPPTRPAGAERTERNRRIAPTPLGGRRAFRGRTARRSASAGPSSFGSACYPLARSTAALRMNSESPCPRCRAASSNNSFSPAEMRTLSCTSRAWSDAAGGGDSPRSNMNATRAVIDSIVDSRQAAGVAPSPSAPGSSSPRPKYQSSLRSRRITTW
jgi:hypothetical protein